MKFFAVVSTVLTLCGLAAASPVPAPADSVNEHAQVLATLEGRQGACGVWTAATKLDGNGSPRQRYLHKQLSQVLTCDPENGCSVGESQSTSYTIGWSISTGTAVTQWITGGFDVSMSWSTGNQYTCMGGPGDSICIWQKIAHTNYKVKTGSLNQCTGFRASGRSEISSPNKNNAGGGFYCVVGTCRSQGEQYWEG
ncbi:uncharacterized protein GGS25DRAFT_533620 [Hypoxylon fragiforme]|uniref:uncharacterized protein n=1 Tax=Hypoxylon fragiforme TaxID=63214 RepID=UPI0020C5D910|nr:uncharacterized protein GGS25DRAFT_533620 [Hypoxylon fragiforme]KAI2604735.1 hypothetical protein GGS25DRAFT_533620 [Hypoxylon fragiforme]